jgi:hypothetical protein
MKSSDIQINHTYRNGDTTRKVLSIDPLLVNDIYYEEKKGVNLSWFRTSRKHFADWAEQDITEVTNETTGTH